MLPPPAGCANTLDPATTLIISPNGTRRTINAYAFFGQVDYDISPRLTATVGLRYDNEDRSQFNLDAGNQAAILAGERTVSFHLPTPKFSLAYKPANDQLIYATIARGFRSGGFNNPLSASTFGVTFNQEEVWSYELGYKGSFADGRIHLSAAAFFEDITNKQDFVFDVNAGTQTLYNIPKSDVKGLEFEVTVKPVRGLSLSGSGGIMDSKIKAFASGRFFFDPFTNASVIGNYLPGFSHWSMNLSADYKTRITESWSGKVHVSYALRGRNYWDVTNQDVEKDVGLLEANIGVQTDHYGVRVWGTNLTDTAYYGNFFNQKTTGLPDVGYRAEPRRFGVAANVKF